MENEKPNQHLHAVGEEVAAGQTQIESPIGCVALGTEQHTEDQGIGEEERHVRQYQAGGIQQSFSLPQHDEQTHQGGEDADKETGFDAVQILEEIEEDPHHHHGEGDDEAVHKHVDIDLGRDGTGGHHQEKSGSFVHGKTPPFMNSIPASVVKIK